MEEKYNKVLSLFKGTDPNREFLNNPFIAGDYAMATDAFCLVLFDKTLVEGIGDPKNYDPKNVLSIIPKERNISFLITVETLKLAISKLPESQDLCNCCDGTGKVKWEFLHHKKDGDCPECNGKIAPQLCSKIKIGTSVFIGTRIKKLIKTAEILGVEEISLVYQTTANKSSVFKIGTVEVMIMPSMYDAFDDMLYFTITI